MSSNDDKYYKLVKQLERITSKTFPECLLNFTYINTVEDKNKLSSCLCGKEKIKIVNNFHCDIDNCNYTIGSSCVEHFNNVINHTEHDALVLNHMHNIYNNYSAGLLQMEYKNCKSCNMLKVKKHYDYKNKLLNLYCKDCVDCKDRIRCIDCRKFIPLGFDYKNNIKERCYGCWSEQKQSMK